MGSAFLYIFLVLCSYVTVNGGYVKYNTGAGIVEGKLNVHLVPHSHDDVGWLKTIDQYYVGSNNSIQGACVENVLDSVMVSLLRNPDRKFVFAEMAFFSRWWYEQSKEIQETVGKLVDGGQLEFVNGGWCMHDEAAVHYIDMIDQTTLGHRLIKKEFNKAPRAGWQIDPFGHSAVQAYLLGAELGFDSVHFARIDYQDRAKRKVDKSLEVIWRGSKTFGSTSQIFTNVFPVHYSPPNGFGFEVDDFYIPVQDNPSLFDYNVKQRVNDFVDAALVQANVTRTNHIMWTMGDDFQYQYAENWFKQLDKLIHYVNKDGRVNALYSTPSMYVDAKHATNEEWPLKTDDYFPYADRINAYWTGYFTSRPALKRYVRMLSGYYLGFLNHHRMSIDGDSHKIGFDIPIGCYVPADGSSYYLVMDDTCESVYNLSVSTDGANIFPWGATIPLPENYITKFYPAARQLEFLAGRSSTGPNTFSLGDALGIAQHHDAVSGTAKQHTTDDYAKRLAIGASETQATINSALSCIASKNSGQCAASKSPFSQCQLLNISFCPPTEEDIPDGKSLVVVAYNPLGWKRTDFVRIPVNDADLVVQDSTGNAIEAQYTKVDNITINLRIFYTKAYLGKSPENVPKFWLLFQVSVPPLGWNTYFISKASAKARSRSGYTTVMDSPQDESIEVGPGSLKMSFSSTTGQLERMFNSKTGVDLPIQQSYLWYGSSDGGLDNQPSGAYIFRPDGAPPTAVSRSVPLKVVRGSLVDEVHQQFSPWIYQVTRLYKDKDHAEVEFTIGPIPVDDSVGKEVITRMTANMVTDKVFYTDSNGRDFLKRVRDYREDWNLSVNQPEAGNYYPINLGIFTKDKKSEFSVLVDRATGGSSIKDGQVELMLHRRMIFDDGRGVGEPLDETTCADNTCEGLMVRGNYYMSLNPLGDGAQWRRTTGQEIYSPLLLAFAHEKLETWTASHLTKGIAMEPNYSLPLNVAVVTLQEFDDGNVLLRLAHLYEAGEDAKYSTLAKVELQKMFTGRKIKEIKETNLSTNQEKSEMKKMYWKVEDDNGDEAAPLRGGPVDNSTLIVELGPMEIRTFLLKF